MRLKLCCEGRKDRGSFTVKIQLPRLFTGVSFHLEDLLSFLAVDLAKTARLFPYTPERVVTPQPNTILGYH
jgi:hypothetical protein